MRRKLTARDLLPSREDFEQSGCPYVEPRKAGYADSVEGESGYKYAVYSRPAVEAVFGSFDSMSDEEKDALAGNLTGWGAHSSGPGRGFSHDPYLLVLNRNILVKQFTGLDI